MKKKILKSIKKHKKCLVCIVMILLLILGFFVGYIYSGLKFIPPHFHANFAMYIDGERVDFSKDQYMEDVAGCSLTGLMSPNDRAHLHENNPDTIHIHDEGVSWGHFFANNGFTFGKGFIILDDGRILVEEIVKGGTDTDVTYILNGEIVDNPYNTLISSKDRLLITYGNQSNEEIEKLYESVSDNAGEYNAKYDPGSCGGTNNNGIVVLIHELLGHKQH